MPHRPGPQLAPARPDASRRPGEWIGRYVQRHTRRLDYALLTHYHDDHIGGIADVAAAVPIGQLLDRGHPLEPPADYRAFRATQNAAAFVPGRTDQIQPRTTVPGLRVQNLAVNSDVWDGSRVRSVFPPNWRQLPAAEQPNENHLSAALRISYGPFDYFAGGDLIGVVLDNLPPWHDLETPVARATGPVDVCVLNHHGVLDSTNPFFLATLRPRVVIIPSWHAMHPDHAVLRRVISPRTYPGPRDVFITTLLDAPKTIFSYLREPFAASEGHIVVRVEPGGRRYRVFVLDAREESSPLLSAHGPYQAQ